MTTDKNNTITKLEATGIGIIIGVACTGGILGIIGMKHAPAIPANTTTTEVQVQKTAHEQICSQPKYKKLCFLQETQEKILDAKAAVNNISVKNREEQAKLTHTIHMPLSAALKETQDLTQVELKKLFPTQKKQVYTP